MAKSGRSWCRRAAASNCPERRAERGPGEGGFTLVEVLICTLVLTIGMIAVAAMLAVTTQMQIGARESARATRLAQDKIDDLMKLDFDTDPEIALVPGGNLNEDAEDYSETPLDYSATPPAPLSGIRLRWAVAPGPTADTRVLTVRVVNLRAQQYRHTDLATIIREWQP